MNWKKIIQAYGDNQSLILGDSPYCVYEWLHNDAPFYVGMGKNYRFSCSGARSKEFLDVYNRGNCRVRIIACGMSENETRQMERSVIEKYQDRYPLVNKQYVVDYYHTPARMEFMQRLKTSMKNMKGRKNKYEETE